MNDRDEKNLDFLMTASKETIADWHKNTSIEDIEYADNLLKTYDSILRIRAADLTFEDTLSSSASFPSVIELLKGLK
jgi:hypothetical protein